MGVLNVTPDSFSDGGKFLDKKAAIRHGLAMVRDGARIIDVGGESTRPGSVEVSAEEELRRVIPVIKALSSRTEALISIDTRKSQVARAGLEAGASIVNDVSGLMHDRAMAGVAAEYGAYLVVMHMRGTPRDMQKKAVYKDLIKEVSGSLRDSIAIAKRAGVPKENIIIESNGISVVIPRAKIAKAKLKIDF